LLAAPKPADLYWEWPLQVVLVALVCVLTWPKEASLRPNRGLLSIVIGALTFVLWVGPDWIDPTYRSFFLFSNSVVGHVGSSMGVASLKSPAVLFWRTVRASTVVPVAEELFWRAWLMRWLIDNDFRRVRLGTYAAGAFWITAFLFGAEHGPYWDVGLVTGVIYNFWMVRSRSLGDCVLVHAVTNLLLSLYVIKDGQWQYWQ
jgi:CAAX prenyl protease-like protein